VQIKVETPDPLVKLVHQLTIISDALKTSWSYGCCKDQFNVHIGDFHYSGTLSEIEFWMFIDLPWHYCYECQSLYHGGYCYCQESLI